MRARFQRRRVAGRDGAYPQFLCAYSNSIPVSEPLRSQDPRIVDPRAIGAVKIFEYDLTRRDREQGMLPRYERICDHDPAVRCTANKHALAAHQVADITDDET